jgi:glucose/arabinose dehydrogenase
VLQKPRRRISTALPLATIGLAAAFVLGPSTNGLPGGVMGGTSSLTAAGPSRGGAGLPSGDPLRPASATLPVAPAPLAPEAFDPGNILLSLAPVATGFHAPVLVTNAHDGSGRLFVVEQAGVIQVVANGSVLPTPFLDLRGGITSGGERGLLGLAFHPRFPTAPYFYVNFTDVNGNTAINRYTVGSNPDVAIATSAFRLMTIAQPYANHNGGNLAFGPDHYLYIGMGDGGSAGDPGNRAQSVNSRLGKMLRIDVDHHTPTQRYISPASNPYVGKAGLDEIWARGLRNPWRWSFDRLTGALWIGDVGQSRWEEVDRSTRVGTIPAGRAVNYGWRVLEARACYRPAVGCSTSAKQAPLAFYPHVTRSVDNCSITGGFVYRGSASPVLYGGYVFGDYCSGRIWVIPATAPAPAKTTVLRSSEASPRLAISSFGEDEAGELYVCDLRAGTIYRLTATARS